MAQQPTNADDWYSPVELKQISEKISPYVMIDIKRPIREGASGSTVLIVDIVINERQYYGDLIDTIKELFKKQDKNLIRELRMVLGLDRDLAYGGLNVSEMIVPLIENAIKASKLRGQNKHLITINELLDVISDRFQDLTDKDREKLICLRYPPEGFHFMKIHGEYDQHTRDSLDKYQKFARESAHVLPELSATIVHNGSILTFYRPAFGDTDFDNTVTPLDSIAREKKYRIVLPVIGKTVEWLREDFLVHKKLDKARPQEWLHSFLGEARYQGDDTVLDRLRKFFESVAEINVNQLIDSDYFQFDSRNILPNPLTLFGKNTLNQTLNNGKLTGELTHAHGDLHMGNIIVRHKKNDHNLNIIDFGDYSEEQSIFFDHIYLEFDVLLNLLPLDSPQLFNDIYDFLDEVLFGEPTEILLPDELPPKFSMESIASCFDNIEKIRESCNRSAMTRDSVEDNRKIFWITAMAVGLNFLRKRTLDSYAIKMLCLMYTAMAYRNLQKLYQIDITTQRHSSTPFQLPWTHADKKVDTVAVEAGQLIDDLLNKTNSRVVLILSPTMGYMTDKLHTQLVERLRWHAEVDEKQLNNAEQNALQAIKLYREAGGDTNLRSCIKQLVQKHQDTQIIQWIRGLIANDRFHVITHDWYDYLNDKDRLNEEQNTTREIKYTQYQSRIIHVCGHTSLSNSIMLPEELTYAHARPSSVSEQIHQTSEKVMHADEEITYVIFVGEHHFDASTLNSRWLNRQKLNKSIKMYHVHTEPDTDALKFQSYDPREFLQKLYTEFSGDPAHITDNIPADELPPYLPEPTNHDDKVTEIRNGDISHWAVVSEPGVGKTKFIKRVTNDGNHHVIIDLAGDTQLRSTVMNIWHYLFDQLPELTPPRFSDYQAQFEHINAGRFSSDHVGTTIQRKYDAVWMYEFFSQMLQKRLANLYVCIDGFQQATSDVQTWIKFHNELDILKAFKDTDMGDWEFFTAPTSGKNFGLADVISLLNDGIAVQHKYRLLVTLRGYIAAEQVVRQWKFYSDQFYPYFLEPLDTKAMKDILEDIIEHDKQILQNYDDPKPYQEGWRKIIATTEEAVLHDQLRHYRDFCDKNMLAVVTVIRVHLTKLNFGFNADRLFPDSGWEKAHCYSAIYEEIMNDYKRKFSPIGLLIPDDINSEERYEQGVKLTLQLLLYRRLNLEILQKLYPGKDCISILIQIDNAQQIFYTELTYQNQQSPETDAQDYQMGSIQRYLVSPSLHKMVLGYYRANKETRDELVHIYCRIINCFWQLLSDSPDRESEYKSRDVLCLVYYYAEIVQILPTRTKPDAERDTFLNQLPENWRSKLPAPKELLRYLAGKYFKDQIQARMGELRTTNRSIWPALPEEYFT